MASDYVFFVCSTINSTYGTLNVEQRFADTLNCIRSIEQYAPGQRILVVDNSNELDWKYQAAMEDRVDRFYRLEHNLFSIMANKQKAKSASEANLMHHALNILGAHYRDCKRIFKISGRYNITDGFDPTAYDGPEFHNKYTFVPQQYVSTFDNWQTQRRVMRLETGLISFPPSLIDELQAMMGSVLWHCLTCPDTCIEESLFQHVPHDKIVPIAKAHVAGNKAEGDGFVSY